MTIRTSGTDRLQITRSTRWRWVVGITLCPGSPVTACWRGLARDLATTLRRSATGRERRGHADRGARVRAARRADAARGGARGRHSSGITWPVKDVSAPSAEFETRWVYAGARLRSGCDPGIACWCIAGVGSGAPGRWRRDCWSSSARRRGGDRAGAGGAAGGDRDARAGAVGACAAGGRRSARCALVAAARVSPRRGDRRCARLPGRVRFAGRDPARVRGEGIRLAAAAGVLEVSDDTQMSLFTLEGQLRAARDGVPLVEAIRQSYLDWYADADGRWNARDRSQAGTGLVRHGCCGSGRRREHVSVGVAAPADGLRGERRSTTARVAAA